MKYSWLLILSCLVGLMTFQACEEQTFDTSSSSKLDFSRDTIRFDTVFTSIGSATRSLKVYNTSEEWVRISDISLGNSDKFRINVDGVSGTSFSNIDIPPSDSIWLFAEVTVDPDQPLSESPFVITETMSFETNGQNQSIVIDAWGQNANHIPGP